MCDEKGASAPFFVLHKYASTDIMAAGITGAI
jgi:hypothetical protein